MPRTFDVSRQFKIVHQKVEKLFFISRRSIQSDVEWAYWVAWQLEEEFGEGCCVIQDWDFDPKGNFIKEMHKGAVCPFTIAIVSPNYFTSDFTADEWTAAFKDRKLILVEVAPCEKQTFGLLSPVSRLSVHGKSKEQARSELLQFIKRIRDFAANKRAKPKTPPEFPGSGTNLNTRIVQTPCNVPHPPSPHFIVPEMSWGQLQEWKSPESPSVNGRRVCVLHGLHGMGKTQAACAFTWEYRAEFSALLWVRGDTKEILRASLGNLCKVDALDLPEQTEQDAAKRIVAVQRWLKEHPGWLLVADNIDAAEARDALLEWVPPSFAGTLLISSCLGDWPPICKQIEFCSWHFSLCAEFFIKRLNLARDDWPIVAFMGDLLGGLPLALEQAAAFIEQTRTPLAFYLPKLISDVRGELGRHSPGATNYPASFVAVLKQSLSELTPEALFLLELASFLAPKGQIMRVYETIASNSTPDRIKAHGIQCSLHAPEKAVMELNRWSLVRHRGMEFDVHPLVQTVVRDALSRVDREHRLTVLWRLFWGRFCQVAAPTDSGCWEVWRIVFPHMEVFIRHMRSGGDQRALGYLLNQMGLFLDSQGLHDKALAALREAVELARVTVGPESPDTAAALSNLAELYSSIGRPADAKPLLLEAVKIVEKNKPLVPHGESSCWNNLGNCLKNLGEREAAEAAFRKALAIDVARGGSDDDFGLTHQSNLADLLSQTNRTEEAEKLYRNAIGKIKDLFRLSCSLTNFGVLLYETGRALEAIEPLKKAVSIRAALFRSGHSELQKPMLHLAIARKKAEGNQG